MCHLSCFQAPEYGPLTQLHTVQKTSWYGGLRAACSGSLCSHVQQNSLHFLSCNIFAACVCFEGNQEAPAEPVFREGGENVASNCQPDDDTKGEGPAVFLPTIYILFYIRSIDFLGCLFNFMCIPGGLAVI